MGEQHAGVPLRRVRADDLRCEEFLYELKASPAGGRATTGTPMSGSGAVEQLPKRAELRKGDSSLRFYKVHKLIVTVSSRQRR